jgi:hypothetical protein
MITFNKLIYDTLELLRGNHIIDDVQLAERQIMFHWTNQRALWIRNEYNKPGRSIDPEIEQDLNCLQLIEVDAAECCSVEVDCIVLRTEKKIPSLIELHDKTALTRVGLPNKFTIPFTISNINKVLYSLSNKYSKNQVYAFLLNGYIYILTNNLAHRMIDYINVRGVFEDPLDLAEFQCNDGSSCFSLDDRYPIKSWMIPYIREQVINSLGIPLKTGKDTANDANEKATQ